MGNIKIRKGEFSTRLELLRAEVAAGFPIMTDDYSNDPLDFNRDFIKHPEASFYGQVVIGYLSHGSRQTQAPVPVTTQELSQIGR